MEEKNESKVSIFFKKYRANKIMLVATLVIIVVLVVVLWTGNLFNTESKTTKLGFEDIGELATQAAYCSEIGIMDASRDLFGIEIPFTQSKYIYSYDVVIKAGFDFEKIQYEVIGKTIKVRLPQPEILSSELEMDSFKIYHESESIFRQITMSEINEGLTELEVRAEEDAIANGLFDNAKANAEVILTGFFTGQYDLEEYKIEFIYN